MLQSDHNLPVCSFVPKFLLNSFSYSWASGPALCPHPVHSYLLAFLISILLLLCLSTALFSAIPHFPPLLCPSFNKCTHCSLRSFKTQLKPHIVCETFPSTGAHAYLFLFWTFIFRVQILQFNTETYGAKDRDHLRFILPHHHLSYLLLEEDIAF